MEAIIVSQLIIYPIKSLGGIALESAIIEPCGLKYDRRWMIVDECGRFISQREFPELALCSVRFDADGFVVDAPGHSTLLIPFHLRSSHTVSVRVWSDETGAQLVDEISNQWFSEYVGAPVQLVVMPENPTRMTSSALSPVSPVSFADGYPILLIGERSLQDLNSKLDNSIPMNRFRPNIVTTGNEAFSEDDWNELLIGSERVFAVKNCSRCGMVTIDQETANKGSEPLKTLTKYRMNGQKVLFGRYLIPGDTGWIHVGDEVEILR